MGVRTIIQSLAAYQKYTNCNCLFDVWVGPPLIYHNYEANYHNYTTHGAPHIITLTPPQSKI
jgi:hypothetical protein